MLIKFLSSAIHLVEFCIIKSIHDRIELGVIESCPQKTLSPQIKLIEIYV